MAKKLWGGRFQKTTDPVFERFSSSMAVDCRLAKFDVVGSLLHVYVLREAGLLSAAEFASLKKGLKAFIGQIDNGRFAYDFSSEDIHTNIQNELARKSPSASAKLQTCRSRNDQVVFATKLYCLVHGSQVRESIFEVQKSLLGLGSLYDDVIMPGYTHMQHAQPVYFKDYVEAHVVMLSRDADRLESSLKRLGISMGSGALAGTPIRSKVYQAGIKKALREAGLQRLIPFISAPDHPLATVSDRDFVIELLSVFAILGMHISRLCEDMVLWSTKEFGFLEVGDGYCTGSSLMPQKKNPDALELLRGTSGPLAGNLVSVLTMMKGLPLSYNRDMQWDKGPLFSSFQLVSDELAILAGLLKTVRINKANIARQVADESLYATDLADDLVARGVPFSAAHEIVGKLVRYCAEQGLRIRDLTDAELKKFYPGWKSAGVAKMLDPLVSVSKKRSART